MVLLRTNLNSIHPRMLCAKFGWNWPSGSGEEDIFVSWSSMYFRYFVFTPLGKGWGPSFEQTWIPSTQGCFVSSLVEIGTVVLEKKMKMWKVYRQTDGRTDGQTDRQTDDGRKVIRKAHLSFQLRWAKKQADSYFSFCLMASFIKWLGENDYF